MWFSKCLLDWAVFLWVLQHYLVVIVAANDFNCPFLKQWLWREALFRPVIKHVVWLVNSVNKFHHISLFSYPALVPYFTFWPRGFMSTSVFSLLKILNLCFVHFFCFWTFYNVGAKILIFFPSELLSVMFISFVNYRPNNCLIFLYFVNDGLLKGTRPSSSRQEAAAPALY